MHSTWSNAADKKQFAGVLAFDLSSAFDCIDIEIICNKLKIYGFDTISINWIKSYLTERSQFVQIGGEVSTTLMHSCYRLTSRQCNLPCSVHNLYQWHRRLDSSFHHERIRRRLYCHCCWWVTWEHEGQTWNWLNKHLNLHGNKFIDCKFFQDNLHDFLKIGTKDPTHISHLVEKLRHRLYLLRHISYLIPRSALKLVADGIVTTHIQYGLSLFGRIKLSETDPSCKEISILQVLHNQMVRIIYQLNIKDKVNMKTVRANNNIPSVNQLTGQAIAMELRKAQLHDTLPLAYDLILENNVPDHRTRSCSQGLLRPPRHRLHSTSSSFPSQASSIWNKLPEYIRISTTDASFKKHLRKWLRSNIP